MADQVDGERRSWFPLALAGGFVVFALVVAFVAYATGRHDHPSTASTVDDVAKLSVEAVENADQELAASLSCGDRGADAAWADVSADATATKSKVKGDATGSFRLTVESDKPAIYDITVGRDGDRSCIQALLVVG